MRIEDRGFHAGRARRAGDIVMDEFDMPRLAGWVAAIIISLGIWAVIIGGLTLL
jgi:hypothetical protein